MNLAAAIRARDAAALPGKRDEDWRWTDLRGLIRAVPEASRPLDPASLAPGPFDALADRKIVVANGAGGGRITVAAGEQRVVALRVVSRGAGAHAGRLAISVEPGGSLTLLETYEGEGGAYLGHFDLTLDVGGVVERIVVASDDPEAVTLSQAAIHLQPRAAFAQTTLTAGARRQRLETRARHLGGHAQLRLDGVYLLDGKRHADLTSVVTHAEPDGKTDQLIKGVARDQARGVFQGRIVVAPGADRTEARMGHHALILSDRAEADAKPELEIYADDVVCAHGATVGALDEDALFYARQRGLPEADARALLTEAFIVEVVERIGHEAAREAARAWVRERLQP